MTSQTIPSFYVSMGYPTPKPMYYYYYIAEHTTTWDNILPPRALATSLQEFSREYRNERMKSYQAFLATHKKIFRSIPFITQVYVCNSMTFNALQDWSDIDLLILTKPWYLRFARAWSWRYMVLHNLKRKAWYWNHSYKFCLSFYVDARYANLISLRYPTWDIYLSYRVAHNVLLYTDHHYRDDYLFYRNPQLLSYLPYHPQTQTISLGIDPARWSNYWKYILELAGATRIGLLIQRTIAWIRWGIINRYKNKKLSHYQQQNIIISNEMLKFHNDKRAFYHNRRKTITSKL